MLRQDHLLRVLKRGRKNFDTILYDALGFANQMRMLLDVLNANVREGSGLL